MPWKQYNATELNYVLIKAREAQKRGEIASYVAFASLVQYFTDNSVS